MTDTSVAPTTTRHRLRRDVGLIGLMFASLGSIIGSGWLLGSLTAAKTAGPASLISWGIAALIIVVLALVHAELGAAYPVAGGTARFPHFAFGSMAGFTAGWMSWLGSVTVAPIEVEAALQYATNYVHGLTHTVHGTDVLTPTGLVVATVLMLLFTIINILGVRRLSHANSATVWWKVAVPIIAIVALMVVSFHPGNFSHGAGGFMPFGVKGVLAALPAGIVFSLLGFEQAIQLGGEARNPKRDLPIAIIGAMILGTIIYVLLQVAFIGALDPHSLTHGWADPMTKGEFGPFAGLATALGLGWLAVVLYIDAFVSPAGTGLIYTGASSRLSYALGRNGYIPAAFETLSPRGVPVFSIIFSFIVGMLVFLPFPGWQGLVAFISSAAAFMYAFAPLSFAALRREDAERERPYKLRGGMFWAPVSFIAANLIVYWSGWTVNWKLFVAIVVGFVLLAISYATRGREDRPPLQLRSSWWLWPYLGGMALISYLGQFDGREVIPFWWDIVVVAAFSLGIYALAMRASLSSHAVIRQVDEEESMIEAEPYAGEELPADVRLRTSER